MNPTTDPPRESPFWWPDMRTIITVLLLAAGIAMAFLFSTGHAVVPESDIGKMAITTVYTLMTLSVQYFVGSSRGVAVTQETIKQQTQTQAVIADTASTVARTAAAVQAASAPVVNGATETAAWTGAAEANTPAAMNDYLQKFPAGVHAAEARARLAAMANP